MRRSVNGKVWVKTLLGVLALAGIGGGGYLAFDSQRYVPLVAPGQYFVQADGAEVDLNQFTRDDVVSELEGWWEVKKETPVKFVQGSFSEKLEDSSWEEMGVDLDLKGSLKAVKFSSYWDALAHKVNKPTVGKKKFLEPILAFGDPDMSGMAEFVEAKQPPIRKAEATWDGNRVVRTYESQGMSFDPSGLKGEIERVVREGGEVAIPVSEGTKEVPDKMLDQIVTVVSEYSTNFNGGQVARSSNIRLAAKTIDGLVLMPGEQFSFNGYLGRRTTQKGYKTAGVYVSGRHDFDVGGGICQVSTTLYNALLMGEIIADARSPHSLPVPYVPLGRDAAVSYPQPDFKFTNQMEVPIAISASTTKNSITFRILGPAKHGREVKFESKMIKSWSNGEKIIDDPSLAPGKRKVVDKGGSGRQVRTWKVIYENGVEVKRVDLGVSTYRGGPTIVAVNKRAPKPSEVVAPGGDGGSSIPASLPTGDGGTGLLPTTPSSGR